MIFAILDIDQFEAGICEATMVTAETLQQVRRAQERQEQEVAVRERDVLRSSLKQAQRRIHSLEAALGRVVHQGS